MDGPALSPREQQILSAIETELRQDGDLDRELSSMRLHRVRDVWRAAPRVPASVLAVLLACSVGLLAVSTQLHSATVLVGFGVVWLATLVVLAFRGLRRLADRSEASRARRKPDTGLDP